MPFSGPRPGRAAARALLLAPLLGFGLACQAPRPVPGWAAAHPEYHAQEDCVFCRIVADQAPSRKVYEDSLVVAFWDIKPRARVHILVVPKQHVRSLEELDRLPVETRAALLDTCMKVARQMGLDERGFRVIANSGPDANQTIQHLHFHVVGGEPLREDAITKDGLAKGS